MFGSLKIYYKPIVRSNLKKNRVSIFDGLWLHLCVLNLAKELKQTSDEIKLIEYFTGLNLFKVKQLYRLFFNGELQARLVYALLVHGALQIIPSSKQFRFVRKLILWPRDLPKLQSRESRLELRHRSNQSIGKGIYLEKSPT